MKMRKKGRSYKTQKAPAIAEFLGAVLITLLANGVKAVIDNSKK